MTYIANVSIGNARPGDVVEVPENEVRGLLRQGYIYLLEEQEPARDEQETQVEMTENDPSPVTAEDDTDQGGTS